MGVQAGRGDQNTEADLMVGAGPGPDLPPDLDQAPPRAPPFPQGAPIPPGPPSASQFPCARSLTPLMGTR